MKENNYTWKFKYKGMIGKNTFISKTIFLYDPQGDKALSTSKKETKNHGTSS
jgi:hypothetical protein